MARLSSTVWVSLLVHVSILAVLMFWAFSEEGGPLAGRGGGSGVTVEIIGGLGPLGEEGRDSVSTPAPPPKKDSDGPKRIAKIDSSRKSKAGSPRGDDIPLGSPGLLGSGQGPGEPGPGSGVGGGPSSVLAQIRARIEHAKRYPLMARRMNMEGVSFVRFEIDGDGRPQGLSLKSSSGFSVLDQEALATIRRAAPFPIYGEPLEIGIRFEIEPPPTPP